PVVPWDQVGPPDRADPLVQAARAARVDQAVPLALQDRNPLVQAAWVHNPVRRPDRKVAASLQVLVLQGKALVVRYLDPVLVPAPE
ncbi:MAG: hypothetical protein ACKO8U_14840, partial [Pirellula sp.]